MFKKNFFENFIKGLAYTCGVEVARMTFKELNRYRDQQLYEKSRQNSIQNGKTNASHVYMNRIGF